MADRRSCVAILRNRGSIDHLALTPFENVSNKAARYIAEAVVEKLSRDEEAEIVAAMRCSANDPEANDISDFASAHDSVTARGD